MKALLALAVALLALPTAALADDSNRVLLTRLGGEGVDETFAAQVDIGLRKEMKKVVADRLIEGAPPPPPGCDEGPCAAALAAEHEAALVVIAVVKPDGDDFKLVARLLDADGTRILAAERTFDKTENYTVLEGLATQLLVPGDYTGRVHFTDVPSGAQVVVDGIPLSPDELAGPVPLTVGVHEVSVEAPGVEPRVQEHAVEYAVDSELSLAPPRPMEERVRDIVAQPAVWPTAVAGGVTGLAAVALIASVADYIAMAVILEVYYYQELEGIRDSFRPRVVAEGVGETVGDWVPYRRAQRNDVVLIGVTAGLTAVAAAATAALATDLLLRPPPEEQE